MNNLHGACLWFKKKIRFGFEKKIMCEVWSSQMLYCFFFLLCLPCDNYNIPPHITTLPTCFFRARKLVQIINWAEILLTWCLKQKSINEWIYELPPLPLTTLEFILIHYKLRHVKLFVIYFSDTVSRGYICRLVLFKLTHFDGKSRHFLSLI